MRFNLLLLKRKQACDCCLALQTAIELSDGRNDMVTSSRQNNNEIIKCNSTRFVALRGKIAPLCVPKDIVSLKFYCQ